MRAHLAHVAFEISDQSLNVLDTPRILSIGGTIWTVGNILPNAGTLQNFGDTLPNQWDCSENWRYFAKRMEMFGTLQILYRLSYGLDGPGIESRWGRDFPPL
jgi:hypothetical protein